MNTQQDILTIVESNIKLLSDGLLSPSEYLMGVWNLLNDNTTFDMVQAQLKFESERAFEEFSTCIQNR